eukprot:scaffold8896_cov95-Isochrysis_galbana.AAC.1
MCAARLHAPGWVAILRPCSSATCPISATYSSSAFFVCEAFELRPAQAPDWWRGRPSQFGPSRALVNRVHKCQSWDEGGRQCTCRALFQGYSSSAFFWATPVRNLLLSTSRLWASGKAVAYVRV